ncbi:MAG: hypothetical protein KDI14_18310, partial [Halioglobus sp.]|nr:hypothetical protein [Halioglobus sp.]
IPRSPPYLLDFIELIPVFFRHGTILGPNAQSFPIAPIQIVGNRPWIVGAWRVKREQNHTIHYKTFQPVSGGTSLSHRSNKHSSHPVWVLVFRGSFRTHRTIGKRSSA